MNSKAFTYVFVYPVGSVTFDFIVTCFATATSYAGLPRFGSVYNGSVQVPVRTLPVRGVRVWVRIRFRRFVSGSPFGSGGSVPC